MRSLFFGSSIASLYVQPHIGGDLALLTGIAKRIVELNAHDERFLTDHCEGWPELKARLAAITWDEVLTRSGVERAELDDIANRYARAERVVFAWTMGITHHAHGVQNVEAIANLALLRGMVGKPHAGMMPIRGHSNVQGIGSVGVTPRLREAVIERLRAHYRAELPTEPGLDTMACLEAADAGQMRFALCLGGNLYGASPDAAFAQRALGRIEQLVYLNTTLNTGHACGLGAETIILPVLARDEEPQATTQESMFNYVRLSDGGPRRHEGPRSEIEIVAHLAQQVLGDSGPIDWREMEDAKNIRGCLAKVVPGWEKIGEIDRTREEFQIAGRTFHTPRFPTPSGRARLFVHALPELPGGEQGLRLMTVRSEGQFNTVVYEDYDLYRGIEGRDVILLHPDDLERLKIEPNRRVDITSSVGRIAGFRAVAFEKIRPGAALMYYPECNVLVPRVIDPASKTPAFKGIPIALTPSTQSGPPAHADLVGLSNAEREAGDGSIHEKQRAC